MFPEPNTNGVGIAEAVEPDAVNGPPDPDEFISLACPLHVLADQCNFLHAKGYEPIFYQPVGMMTSNLVGANGGQQQMPAMVVLFRQRRDEKGRGATRRLAIPSMSWSEIAASAYRAYAAVTGNKNFRGEQMPAFEQLPFRIRAAWEASVRQADECLEQGEPPDELLWAGWAPEASSS